MASFPETKAPNSESGNFNETVEFAVLCCGNIQKNNNKFYCLEIQKNNSGRYRLFCSRGRVGSTTVYGIRDKLNGSYIDDESTIKKEFHTIVSKKLKGGSKSQYTLVETHKPTVGSNNICGISTGSVKQNVDFNDKVKDLNLDGPSKKILKQAYDENVHSIQASTSITVTSSGLETSLGPLTPAHIEEARKCLVEMKKLNTKKKLKFKNSDAVTLNNMYLSMVPRDMGRTMSEDDMVLTDTRLMEEFDLLDQLGAAIQVTSASNDNLSLGFSIDNNKSALSDVSKAFEDSRAGNHHNLKRWKVARVYDVLIEKERDRFDACKLHKERVLWHGSRNCNVLSILMNGLIIPPHNAPHVTGRMFGNGVYAASNSTKALNYSIGYWSSSGNKYPNAFLFVVKFKMGKIHEPNRSCFSGAPSGYNSVHAKKSKAGLHNDEFIVYSLNQQSVYQLVELKEK